MLAHLLRIDATDSVGRDLPLLLASVDDARCCHLDDRQWEPNVARLPALRYDFFGGDFRGAIGRPTASFDVVTEGLADFAERRFADARMRLWTGELGDHFYKYRLRFDGKLTGDPQVTDGIASFEAATDDTWLDKPLLSLFAGTGAAEGPDELEGTLIPLLLGACRFAPGTLVDAVDNVYRLSGPGPIEAVIAVYDRAVSLGPSSGDHADFAALVAADIANGSWATCLAEGLVRLGAPADGQVSFDVSGDNGGTGGFVRLPGAIIGRLVELAGGSADARNLSALDAARPWNLSLALLSQTTARQAIQELADSVCAVAGVSWTGKLFVQPLGTAEATFTLASDGSSDLAVDRVAQLPAGAPFWRHATKAEITWVVHDTNNIASEYVLRGEWNADRVYRLDDLVFSADGSAWVYVNETPSSGNAPPAWPTTSNAWWQNATSAPVAEPGADITSFITGPAETVVQCTYDGTPKAGQVNPREVSFIFLKNGVDETDNAGWTVSVVSGGIAGTMDPDTGILDITAANSDGEFEIVAVLGDRERAFRHKVRRELDAAPGGSGGGSSASGTVNLAGLTTSATAISDPITVTAGSAGEVELNATYYFNGAVGDSMTVQWYKDNGAGTFVAIGSSMPADYAISFDGYAKAKIPGHGEVSETDTGLTPSTAYIYKLYGWASDGNVDVSGGVSGVGS